MEQRMQIALKAAQTAYNNNEVPVGAIIVDNCTNEIIATANNLVETLNDPLAHAEMLVIKTAVEKLGTKSLKNCDIYVTLEPCPMCASAISLARIRRLYFGAYDPKSGGTEHGAKIFDHNTCHHKPDIYGGICEEKCSQILTKFFKEKR